MTGKCMRGRRSRLAYCFVFANLLIQIIGYFYYRELPDFFWFLSNCIMIMAPLLFGVGKGLLCLGPMAAA